LTEALTGSTIITHNEETVTVRPVFDGDPPAATMKEGTGVRERLL
jgi:hypothetical protein